MTPPTRLEVVLIVVGVLVVAGMVWLLGHVDTTGFGHVNRA